MGNKSIDFSELHIGRSDLEKIVGFRPRNTEIYKKAFIHKSMQKIVRKKQKESPDEKILPFYLESNERLEFLGDAVLNLIVAGYLFKKYPDKDEGFLTRIRTKLVSGKNCAHLAKKLGLGDYMLLSNHVISINGKNNNRILEDTMEAFIGALYLDLGFELSGKFVLNLIEKYVDMDTIKTDTNYKDILLRYSQKINIDHPKYIVEKQEGPPHQRFFTISVTLSKEIKGIGSAKSKKIAEQLSAKNALSKVDYEDLQGIIDRDLIS